MLPLSPAETLGVAQEESLTVTSRHSCISLVHILPSLTAVRLRSADAVVVFAIYSLLQLQVLHWDDDIELGQLPGLQDHRDCLAPLTCLTRLTELFLGCHVCNPDVPDLAPLKLLVMRLARGVQSCKLVSLHTLVMRESQVDFRQSHLPSLRNLELYDCEAFQLPLGAQITYLDLRGRLPMALADLTSVR